MKFLVLALCVCAASAASTFQPWQAAQRGAVATAQAVASAPAFVGQTIVEPAARTYVAAKNVIPREEQAATILRQDNEVAADGFNSSYETSNGIAVQSSGALKKVGESESLAIQGSYQYTNPDGSLVQLSYIADENGFQPKSDILPVGPAIPEAIIRSLQYITAHPQKIEY